MKCFSSVSELDALFFYPRALLIIIILVWKGSTDCYVVSVDRMKTQIKCESELCSLTVRRA